MILSRRLKTLNFFSITADTRGVWPSSAPKKDVSEWKKVRPQGRVVSDDEKEEHMPIPASVPRDIPILVVDDFATMRRIVRNSLRQLGFTNVVEAADGSEALNHLKESAFEFIISEWNMPTLNGSELLRAVRSDQKHRETPLLVITTESQRTNVIAHEKDRVSSYVVKPLTTDILESKMEGLLCQWEDHASRGH